MALEPVGKDVDKLYSSLEKDAKKLDQLAQGVTEDLLVRIRFSQDYELGLLRQLELYLATQGKEKQQKGKKDK